ncbi:MAG: kynureninase [Bacteroidetes bacterium]|nr:kynureninase [Bacteroidota bacterium]MBX7130117.1 kynureninase [Flavobacteriales bacterium]MCC6654362.1 kynureninase [Flavobacteriales bacterium]HMU14632.1 kynureninase [Flavobacteriales bacterium]HMW97756.1 kynureninase [Flavobacteriales bacterium]
MPQTHQNTLAHARERDAADPLRSFRDEFLFPQHNGNPVIYFTGNSLGLQPKGAAAALKQELDDWARYGVEAHFQAKHPWYPYHEFFSESLARIVGAEPTEVVAMNGLTTNLHLLLVSFYRPAGKRVRILCEERPFPSDTYAFHSQVEFHGLDPKDTVVSMKPRAGEHTLRTEDIVKRIGELGDELALVCFGGVNFLTGQAFDMQAITDAGHRAGAVVGFDLAHAAGNLKLDLHGWNTDFACWCSYKYLNSGPGSVAGAFVHERHHREKLPRFAGWWGHDKNERFLMEPEFKPMASAEAWQLSNAPVFSMAVHRAALDLFDRAGMDALRAKSEELTGYLAFVLKTISAAHGDPFTIITPDDPAQRGCQLSLLVRENGRALFDTLTRNGVVVDWREPDPSTSLRAGVIRMAPVPLYNSFEDVFRFGGILDNALRS